MNIIKTLVIFSLCALAISCSIPQVDEALERASKSADAVEAYKLLKDAKSQDDNNTFSKFDIEFYLALNRYMVLAAEQMDATALDDLFQKVELRYGENISYGTDIPTEFSEIPKINEEKRAELVPRILIDAHTSSDPNLLSLAGAIQSEGEYVIRDTVAAISFLARAWSLGDKRAASKAAFLYKSINDYQNAYLWSLRCTSECTRGIQINLENLEDKLAPEATLFIQKKAADLTVMEIDTKV